MTDHKKPSMPFRVFLVLAGVTLYSMSIGPASRLEGNGDGPLIVAYRMFYSPIIWVYEHGPDSVHDAIHLYVESWN